MTTDHQHAMRLQHQQLQPQHLTLFQLEVLVQAE